MGILHFFGVSGTADDLEHLYEQILRLPHIARDSRASSLAVDLSRTYARLYSEGNLELRQKLGEFTRTVLADRFRKLHQAQMEEISPGVRMTVDNSQTLEYMLLFTFLTLTRDLGDFPEINDIYERERRMQNESGVEKRAPPEVVVDLAKVMEGMRYRRQD